MKIECIPSGYLETNTYLVVDEATKKGFIVDPGAFSDRLLNIIKEGGYKIEHIVLTHGHGDHIGGVSRYMQELEKCQLVVGSEEKEILANAANNSSRECTGKHIELEADIWVNDMDTLKIGNMELLFLHTPGHTEGGISIVLEDVVFSGDTLFRESIGRTDFYSGSYPQICKSIKEKLFTLPDSTKVLPGHMGASTIGHEKEYNPFV